MMTGKEDKKTLSQNMLGNEKSNSLNQELDKCEKEHIEDEVPEERECMTGKSE